MADPFGVVGEELDQAARKLEGTAMEYGCPVVSAAWLNAGVTGHVEMSEQMAGFGEFITDVLNVLRQQLDIAADSLRQVNQLVCTMEDDAVSSIGQVSMPTFNTHTESYQ